MWVYDRKKSKESESIFQTKKFYFKRHKLFVSCIHLMKGTVTHESLCLLIEFASLKKVVTRLSHFRKFCLIPPPSKYGLFPIKHLSGFYHSTPVMFFIFCCWSFVMRNKIASINFCLLCGCTDSDHKRWHTQSNLRWVNDGYKKQFLGQHSRMVWKDTHVLINMSGTNWQKVPIGKWNCCRTCSICLYTTSIKVLICSY